MKVVFVSNFINHHQTPICDELNTLCDGDFCFVETQDMPLSFKKGGFPNIVRPYLVKAWRSEEEKQKALDLCENADVLVAGGGKFILPYEKKRLLKDRLTFEYAERSFKRGWINFFSPTNLLMQFYYHTLFYNKPFYKLCASAYTARDMYLQHAFIGKCLKYGYFTQIPNINIEKVIDAKYQRHHIKIIWCARFIKLKHPEMAILLAEKLYQKGYDFELNMIGSGEMVDEIKKMIEIKGLSSYVHLLGNFPNGEVLRIMSEHHIFLFTSDKHEGWGAVLNEAMGQGCCPVASHLIGSVPFLLKHKDNGVVFESGNIDSLVANVEYLLQNREELKKLSYKSYMTVKNIWNPKVAAERLMVVFKNFLNNNYALYDDGPFSRALPISEKYNE